MTKSTETSNGQGRFSRRSAVKAMVGAGAAFVLPGTDLLAQESIDFTPLELNGSGQQYVNPAVSKLDQDEERLLDDLLSGNQQGERNDLAQLDRDLRGIQSNPGITLGDPGGFQQELDRCRGRIRTTLSSGAFGWGGIRPCMKEIDFFVGHWYPCNDILEIASCEHKIWHCLNYQPNDLLLTYYFQHLVYELQSICVYHGSSDFRFRGHKQQLFSLCTRYSQDLEFANYSACRVDFQRLTTATSLFFRQYYPQWC